MFYCSSLPKPILPSPTLDTANRRQVAYSHATGRRLPGHLSHMVMSHIKCRWNRWCRKLVAAAQERTLLDVTRKDADPCNVEPQVFGHCSVPDFSGIEAFVHFTKSQLCRSTDCILSTNRKSAFPIHSCERIGVPPQASNCFIQPRSVARLQDDPSLANRLPGQSNTFGEHDMFTEKNCVLFKFSHPNNFLL